VITCGLSGSGKTWLSQQIMTQRGAIRIRSDVERKRMVGLRAAQSSASLPDPDLYSLAVNEQVYSALLACARSVLESGESIIVDAAFLKRSERLAFLELAAELRVPFAILHCVAPSETLLTRLRERQQQGTDASEADAAVMEQQVGRWEDFAAREVPSVLELRTHDPQSMHVALEHSFAAPL